jgi:prepilin-type N-terminal cleavage/methylation domain-containing protein
MKRTSGFTLVELIVVVAILGIFGGAIYTLFQTSNRTYVVQDHVVAMQQDARYGLDYLADNIRMAGYDPRVVGEKTFCFQISATWDGVTVGTNATSIAFTLDDDQNGAVPLDSDPQAPKDRERVAFRLDSGQLQRFRNSAASGVNGTWETVISGVDTAASSITYWYADGTSSAASGLPNDSDGLPNNDADNIRDVQITLAMNPPDLYGNQFQAKSYTTLVKCRNMALK